MKIFRTFAVCAILASAAVARPVSAQEYATDRGSLILGGSAGVTRSSYSQVLEGSTRDSHSTYAYLSPVVEYFVSPGLAVGGTLNVIHHGGDGSSFTSYGAGPIVSYYFGRGEQTVHPYVSGQASLSSAGSGASGLYGASAGALYMLSRSVGLDAGVFYRRQSVADSESHSSNLGLALGFSAFTF